MCLAQPCLVAAPTGRAALPVTPRHFGSAVHQQAASPALWRCMGMRNELGEPDFSPASASPAPASPQASARAPIPAPLAPTADAAFPQKIHLPLSLLTFLPVFLPVSAHLILFPTLPLPSSSICLAVHPARLCSCWGDKCRWEKPGEHPEVSAACPGSPQPGLLQLALGSVGASKAPSAQGFLGSSSATSWIPPSSKASAGKLPATVSQGRLLLFQAAVGRAEMGQASLHGLDNHPEKRERWFA